MTPIERQILANLQHFAEFDAERERGRDVEKIIAAYLLSILFETDAARREMELARLQSDLINHFERAVQPKAIAIGAAAAVAIIGIASGGLVRQPNISVTEGQTRARAVTELRQRADDRRSVVAAAVDDALNTLKNKLTQFWTEPGNGTARERMAKLRKIHEEQAEKIRQYQVAMIAFIGGETSRPTAPKLQYWDAMSQAVRESFRAQSRRGAQDEELRVFILAGFERYEWITVNGPFACPDCQALAGRQESFSRWMQIGLPRSGKTVCRDRCYCAIYPIEATVFLPSSVIRYNNESGKPRFRFGDAA